MSYLFFLKPLTDMLWQYKIFSLALGGGMYILVLGCFGFHKLNYIIQNKNRANLLVLILLMLLTLSFYNGMSKTCAILYFKISTALILFYLAQTLSMREVENTYKYLTISFIIVVSINLIYLLTGKGFQTWGRTTTFSGVYYFKYDLALTFLQAATIFRKHIVLPSRRLFQRMSFAFIFIVSPFVIFLTNSRLFYLVYFIFLAYMLWEKTTYTKIGKQSFKTLFKLFGALLGCFILFISLLNFISRLDYFATHNFLALDLSWANLFDHRNTQGRIVIWTMILNNFFSGSILNQWFGYDLFADFRFNWELGRDAHSTYIKLLVCTGFIGLTAFFFLVYDVFKKYVKLLISATDKVQLFYIHTAGILFFSFLIAGLTSSNIFYTQTTWLVFLFCGLLFNRRILKAQS